MPIKKYVLPVLFLLACGRLNAQDYRPVNPNATSGTKKILKFLYGIKGKYTMSGQQNYNSDRNVFSDSAKNITGKYPAVWGSDFMNWGDKDLGPQIVEEAIKKAKDGYLVTLMWHEGNPTQEPPYDFEKNVKGKLTDAQWTELTTPGTALYNKWLGRGGGGAGGRGRGQEAGGAGGGRPYH